MGHRTVVGCWQQQLSNEPAMYEVDGTCSILVAWHRVGTRSNGSNSTDHLYNDSAAFVRILIAVDMVIVMVNF
jgi:hypothetical protein